MKSYSSQEVIKMLKQDGWKLKNVVGDHYQFVHPEKKGKVTIPHKRKGLSIFELKSIEKQSGLKF